MSCTEVFHNIGAWILKPLYFAKALKVKCMNIEHTRYKTH